MGGVFVQFSCDGCEAKAEARLRSEFVSVSDAAPEGWVAFDPYTGCCYCATCWADIQKPTQVTVDPDTRGQSETSEEDK